MPSNANTAIVMPVATSTNSAAEITCSVPPARIVCWGASGSQLSRNEPVSHMPTRPTPTMAAAPAISATSSVAGRTAARTARCPSAV